MTIRDFIKRFENEKEIKSWLRRQNKDYLYSIYMESTNHDGVGYREITKEELKDMFLDAYYKKEEEKIYDEFI